MGDVRTVVRAVSVCFLFMAVLPVRSSIAQTITAHRTDTPVTIDGVLNDPVWETADVIEGLTQFEPVYDAPSGFKTTVRILYDNSHLYIAFLCIDPEPDRITAKDTMRDASFMNDDAVVVLLDTFHDRNSAYYFGVNPNGTQQDGRLADNGSIDDIRWDGRWRTNARITSEGWICEIAIPFETLIYDAKAQTWGFTVERRIARNRERSFWTRGLISPDRVSQFGTLAGLYLEHADVKRYTFIPYAQMQVSKGRKPHTEYGGDFRYNVTSNLSVEATMNPDFATVEADVEQVNLTRFELEYPEKRPFFLEGAENYNTRIQQFYSRRIGEIPWGAKMNGKIAGLKVNSLMTMSDPSTSGAVVPTGKDAIYTVFRVTREAASGSNIGLIGANRTYHDENSGSLGLAGTFFFTDVLGMTSQAIKTWGVKNRGTWAGFVRPAYDSQFTHFHLRYSHFGEGVMENINPVGFISDDDRREFDTSYSRHIWFNHHGIDEFIVGVNYNQYYSQAGTLRRWEDANNISVKFLKKWEYTVEYTEEFIRFERNYRNTLLTNEVEYDTKQGTITHLNYTFGTNYDRDFEKLEAGFNTKLLTGWDVEYNIFRHWFNPGNIEDNSWIHYIRSTYYITPDFFFKVFYQSKYSMYGNAELLDNELLRKDVQVLFVWRFLPPFGSLQLAYQEGNVHAADSTDGNLKSVFCKLSWVL